MRLTVVVVEIVGDDRQHHVERRGAAGAGVDVAVDLEQVGIDADLREGFLEAGQVFPVDGAALVLSRPAAPSVWAAVQSAPIFTPRLYSSRSQADRDFE
jgi:hypothetical protein